MKNHSVIHVDPSAKTIDESIITFDSINYYVDNQQCCNLRSLACSKKDRKQILYSLSGVFPRGMNAIMGPTGSGKSSLLDILADRKDRRGLDGEILLNGERQGSHLKYRVGYVVQDDILSGSLTVKENLMFSANVRLSKKLSKKEKNEIVDEVLFELGLEKCAETIIGNDFKRGVSGGERKRTNIGMELILSPTVLFLDEPTTGLDSSTANNVMEYLHRLSRKGTIIFSIHQPRYSIFKLFDRIYLIGAGRCIYHGQAENVLQYFSSIGYQCEEHNNPADFLLDLCQTDRNQSSDDVEETSSTLLAIRLNEIYSKSTIYQSIANEISEEKKRSPMNINNEKSVVNKSRFNDFLYLSQRTFRNSFRDPSLVLLQTAISLILGLLVGLIYLNLDRTIERGIKNRSGAIFFIVTNQVFSNLSALDLFIKERALFVHENLSGYYHVLTYFLSKIICDILPLRTLPALGFSILVYFMMAFQRSAENFFLFFFCIWLTSICASTLCFFISSTVNNAGIANLFAALFCVLTLIFSGFLVEINSVLAFLQWIQYFSIFRYSTNILSINEFKGLTLCLANQTEICPKTGDDILNELSIEHSTNWHLWKNYFALAMISLGFLILTYVQLRRMKKTK